MEGDKFGRMIHDILSCRNFAVVGASANPEKYGHKVYQHLKAAGYNVSAVNPNLDELLGDPVYPRLDNVPGSLDCVVTVVPPPVTYEIVREAGQIRVPYVWMQPGSESDSAVIEAHAQGIQVVYGGPCIMVALATRRTVARDEAP